MAAVKTEHKHMHGNEDRETAVEDMRGTGKCSGKAGQGPTA